MIRTLTFITAALLTAASAQAMSPTGYLGGSQTLSHCGTVPVANKIYTNSPLNISIIQKKLAHLGYDVGPRGIDGVYGRDTKSAVKQFQYDYGLKQDSAVGHQTAMALAYISHPLPNVQNCKRPYTLIVR